MFDLQGWQHRIEGGFGMRLTVYTDYTLRLLMYLAIREDGLPTIGEVAEAYGIAKNHLTKVAHQLGLAGYVTTVRGRGGGLRLAKPAERIGIGEVVRRTEPDMTLVPCFEPLGGPCPIAPACRLRNALNEAQQAFLKVLDSYSLADLVTQRSELRALLALPGSPHRQREAGARASESLSLKHRRSRPGGI
jgi:Rrf2 family transcriptional regulator, nitric oxide-sensitive transcriptional repressor